jgi:hypothetical protein
VRFGLPAESVAPLRPLLYDALATSEPAMFRCGVHVAAKLYFADQQARASAVVNRVKQVLLDNIEVGQKPNGPLFRGELERGFDDVLKHRNSLPDCCGGEAWNLVTRVLHRWDGRAGSDLRLLVRCGEALGESIMEARWLAAARGRVGRLTVIGPVAAHRLLRGIEGVDGVVDLDCDLAEEIDRADYYIIGDCLPAVLRGDYYGRVPYIKCDPLPRRPRLRVGLVWAASQDTKYGTMRSVPLAELAPLGDIDVEFHALTTHNPRADDQRPPGLKMVEHADQVRDLEDLRSIIECLDLVIGADTSVTNLSCAMGVTSWVMLPHVACWRWGLQDAARTPWYPAARLFRQRDAGDWAPVIASVVDALRGIA